MRRPIIQKSKMWNLLEIGFLSFTWPFFTRSTYIHNNIIWSLKCKISFCSFICFLCMIEMRDRVWWYITQQNWQKKWDIWYFYDHVANFYFFLFFLSSRCCDILKRKATWYLIEWVANPLAKEQHKYHYIFFFACFVVILW